MVGYHYSDIKNNKKEEKGLLVVCIKNKLYAFLTTQIKDMDGVPR